jgi:hypothetical protein
VSEIKKRIIAVDDSLDPVKEILKTEGYRVIGISENGIDRASAVVVNSIDDNFLGFQDTSTRASVIDARGKTPEEILKEIKDRQV